MRLLLLLSALLTALTGAMAGTAASAQPVEASASVGVGAKAGVVAGRVVMPLPDGRRASGADALRYRTRPVSARETRRFGERRRE